MRPKSVHTVVCLIQYHSRRLDNNDRMCRMEPNRVMTLVNRSRTELAYVTHHEREISGARMLGQEYEDICLNHASAYSTRYRVLVQFSNRSRH